MQKLIIPLFVTLFMVVAMAFMALTPQVTLCEPPKVELSEIAGFTSEPVEVSEAEHKTLPSDTAFIKRLFRNQRGDWFAVSVVIGGRSKNSVHRPELCLPSQGFRMTRPRTVSVGDNSWRFITLDGGVGRASNGFAYTFFNQDGFHTSSHIRRIFRDIWDRSILNRIDRWVMITIYSSVVDDEGMKDFISQLKL